jgi:uncharacterized membrane protein YdjX (TVP38/TMEM64 family)
VNLRRIWPAAVIVALVGWALWSWWSDGVIGALMDAARGDGSTRDTIRDFVLSAGPLAPLVYVAAVTVEVLIAPIPGLLLYAPGGAIFGGILGGTLGLVGNVAGAALAAWLAGAAGPRMAGSGSSSRLAPLVDRVRERGILVVMLLRINPLTSSDLVSYAAGLAGVPVWRVAAGTAIGMAPLCYAQAYAADWLFDVLPGSGVIIAVLALSYVVVALWLLFRGTLSER